MHDNSTFALPRLMEEHLAIGWSCELIKEEAVTCMYACTPSLEPSHFQ